MNVYYHSISNLDCINNGCQSRLLGPCIVLLLLLRLVSLRCPRLSKWQHVPARPLPGSVARSSRSRPHPSVRPRIPTRCALCSSALLPGHDSRTGVGFRAPRCVRPRPRVSAPAPNPVRPSVRRAPATGPPPVKSGQSTLPGTPDACPGDGDESRIAGAFLLARSRTHGGSLTDGACHRTVLGRKYSRGGPTHATHRTAIGRRSSGGPCRPMPTRRTPPRGATAPHPSGGKRVDGR